MFAAKKNQMKNMKLSKRTLVIKFYSFEMEKMLIVMKQICLNIDLIKM